MNNKLIKDKSHRYAFEKECTECLYHSSCEERESCSKYNISRIDYQEGYLSAIRDHIKAFAPKKQTKCKGK